MLNVNDYIRYGSKGIFQIKEIIKRKNAQGKKEAWYVLYSNKNGVETSVTTPAANDSIRKILTKEEVEKLIEDMPGLSTIWTENKNVRYERFSNILDSGNIYMLAQLIKTLYEAKQERLEKGKQLPVKDKEIFAFAENLMQEEIALSYQINKEEVTDLILQKIAA